MKSSNKRFYSWSMVTYGSKEEIRRFCTEQGRNWAFACHDKDENKEPHTHVVITFEQVKSFASVVRLAKSYMPEVNTFCEPVQDLGGALLYLTHETQSALEEGKYQYQRNIVEYSSKAFYEKYVKGEEITENDQFVEDLLCPEKDFSVIRLAKRYGRDFIKNVKSYMDFRAMALSEQMGINALHYYYGSYPTVEREFIQRNGEAVNDFIKGEM